MMASSMRPYVARMRPCVPGLQPYVSQACWRDMMAISSLGFLVYVVGIPALLSWKLAVNRHYAVFTKSISLQVIGH